MIFLDVTKTGRAGHRSGLTRVSGRLQGELGDAAKPVGWKEGFKWEGGRRPAPMRTDDWLVTAELFSEPERPGIREYLRNPPCRTAAIFHDAIPLKHPHITWPRSVARHADYMKLLSLFRRVWAVSEASRSDLLGFWKYQGVLNPPPVEVLPLGADFNAGTRQAAGRPNAPAGRLPRLLQVGILEPRKNQGFLMEVCESLWKEGLRFELHFVGRVNPHFGGPLLKRLRALQAAGRGVHHHPSADDAALEDLYRRSTAVAFPTIAEGCGLPVLESLWMGVPCLCSDLPVLRETADGGGCLALPTGDAPAWREGIRSVLQDGAVTSRLAAEAVSRPLPTWSAAAEFLRSALEGKNAGPAIAQH